MATKYVSSLTGSEMDSALLDMAYHNSEAYAVGTRNGVAVGSSDVTYHNNSKYWAEQVYGYTDRAEDAANRAESAVPSGTAGAVFFDRAQTLTTAQQEQARKNIMAGGSNRNLLDNWYFVGGGSQLGDGIFPINQRGQTSYSGASNTIDRWKTENSSISVGADGLTWTATGDNNQFEQIIENYKLIEGETYTATIDCDILAGSARLFVGGISSPWPTVAGSTVNVSSGITKVTFTFARESGYTGRYKLALSSVGSCTAKLRKFKLEKGTVSTLANDAPPDYGTELIKCRGYFERIHSLGSSEIVGMGMGVSASSVRIGIPSLICHTIQSVTYSGGGLLLEGGGNYRTLTSIGKLNTTPKNGFLTVTCGSSDAITLYQTYALVGTAAGGYIDISADL